MTVQRSRTYVALGLVIGTILVLLLLLLVMKLTSVCGCTQPATTTPVIEAIQAQVETPVVATQSSPDAK